MTVLLCWFFDVFFFKQKTAYEMRISDWSSDVCSSDLLLFSGDGKHAWLTMEMTAQVAVFDYQDGRLTQRQLVDLATGKPQPGRAAAALHEIGRASCRERVCQYV